MVFQFHQIESGQLAEDCGGSPGREDEERAMDVVFSGVQPTGKMHIGNYLGAISLWVRNQHRYRNFFCIVDLHALTIPENIDPRELRQNSFDAAALYIACGIDPKQSVIFIQSQVKQHTELAWLLNCVTPMGWMNRMTQFKVKSKSAETIGVGLYDYPVLQPPISCSTRQTWYR